MTIERGSMVTPVARDEATAALQQQESGKRKLRELESVMEHIQVLLAAEKCSYPCCKDYLSVSSSPSSGPSEGGINEAWRRKLCEWCYEVVDHFGFDREVVSIALDYLDRSVAARTGPSMEPVAKQDFQLLAVTSLYIAVKTHGLTECADGPRRKLKIEAFTQLSRGVFPVETIEATERQILTDLRWRMNPPTNLRFITFFLRLLPTWTINGDLRSHESVKSILYEVSRYIAELSVCVSKFSFSLHSSMIAYASILCSMEVLKDTVPFPLVARKQFLENVTEASGFYAEMPRVQAACFMLKELCPNMFDGDGLPSEFLVSQPVIIEDQGDQGSSAGKQSPVSVAEDLHDSPSSSRKRSRTCREGQPPGHA